MIARSILNHKKTVSRKSHLMEEGPSIRTLKFPLNPGFPSAFNCFFNLRRIFLLIKKKKKIIYIKEWTMSNKSNKTKTINICTIRNLFLCGFLLIWVQKIYPHMRRSVSTDCLNLNKLLLVNIPEIDYSGRPRVYNIMF
jgi:hypothetical protein